MIHIGVASENNHKCEFVRTGKTLRFATNNLIEVRCVHCNYTTYYGEHDLQRITMLTDVNCTH